MTQILIWPFRTNLRSGLRRVDDLAVDRGVSLGAASGPVLNLSEKICGSSQIQDSITIINDWLINDSLIITDWLFIGEFGEKLLIDYY